MIQIVLMFEISDIQNVKELMTLTKSGLGH